MTYVCQQQIQLTLQKATSDSEVLAVYKTIPNFPMGCIIQLVYVKLTNKSSYIYPAGELTGK